MQLLDARRGISVTGVCITVEDLQRKTACGWELPCKSHSPYRPAVKVLRTHVRNECSPTICLPGSHHLQAAWRGFASPTDRQRIQAFIRRCERSRFTPPDLPSFTDLCREADNNLFDSILNNSLHVLRHLLPPPSQASQHYSLRFWRHNLQLSIGPTSLSDINFLHRMLYSDSYWHIFLSSIVHVQRCRTVLPTVFNIKRSSSSSCCKTGPKSGIFHS